MNSNRTDLVKMGKYIAKLRKDKKYTQRQLGDMIDIPYKTISKWENGVVAPDITVLKILANVLEVTVDEILCGEKLDDLEKKNSSTINGIRIYVNEEKRKILKIFSLIIILITLVFSIFIYIDKYYDLKIYDLESNSDVYFIKGYLISNVKQSYIMLDNFSYISEDLGTLDEVKISKLRISLLYKDEELISKEYEYENPVFLHRCFENYFLFYSDKKLLKSNDFLVNIFYVDNDGLEYNFSVKLGR